jgi:integrase
MTLGSVKVLDASKARQTARDLLAAVRLGRDPAAERTESHSRASVAEFSDIIEHFLARQEARLRPKSYRETKRYLQELWKPLHRLHLLRISRADVAMRLGTLTLENGPIAADRARAALSAFFGWAIREGLCEGNPVLGTNKAATVRSRDRVLSDEDIKAIWNALPDSDYGRIVRLLILTGQRRDEIGGLPWSEINQAKRVLTLSKDRTKNHRPHEVPLSKLALAILLEQPVRADRDLVYGDGPRKNGHNDTLPQCRGYQGWSKSKAALDETTSWIKPWRLHDIRRTVATRMGDELGVQPHIIEAVLNHVSGHKAGIAGIYNHATYAEQKRTALDMWAEHLEKILRRKTDTAIPQI